MLENYINEITKKSFKLKLVCLCDQFTRRLDFGKEIVDESWMKCKTCNGYHDLCRKYKS